VPRKKDTIQRNAVNTVNRNGRQKSLKFLGIIVQKKSHNFNLVNSDHLIADYDHVILNKNNYATQFHSARNSTLIISCQPEQKHKLYCRESPALFFIEFHPSKTISYRSRNSFTHHSHKAIKFMYIIRVKQIGRCTKLEYYLTLMLRCPKWTPLLYVNWIEHISGPFLRHIITFTLCEWAEVFIYFVLTNSFLNLNNIDLTFCCHIK
jgi:hypothetical protein